MECKDDILKPAIKWTEALDAVQAEQAAVRSSMAQSSRETMPVPKSRGLLHQDLLVAIPLSWLCC